jgi:hypothetical protein
VRHSATDQATGVSADATLAAKPWGTQVSFAVSNIRGPLSCRLVAVGKDGHSEVLSTWSVPPEGYGTSEQSQPLSLQTATALTPDQIAGLQVQAVEAGRPAKTLVTVLS